jgi:hypothetical protein
MIEDDARGAILASLKTPSRFEKLIVDYLALFRPVKTALSFNRVATLLRELQPMIDNARVTRNGQSYLATQDYWERAFDEVVNIRRSSLTLPLKSHGYLIEIICGYSRKDAAKAEAAREQQRAGHTPVGYVERITPAVRAPPPNQKQIPAEAVAALSKFKRSTEYINEEGVQHGN